jgi:hypothetical protein
MEALDELDRAVEQYDLRRPQFGDGVVSEYLKRRGAGLLTSFEVEQWARRRLSRPEAVVINVETVNAIVDRRVAAERAEREQEVALVFARSMALLLRMSCECAGPWGPKEISGAVCALPDCPPRAKEWDTRVWKTRVYEPIRRQLRGVERPNRESQPARSVPAHKM